MLHNTLNIILAILVLASTTGVSVSKHFCQNRLVDMSLNQPAKKCGMEMEPTTGFCKGTSVSKEDCCTDENRFLKVETQFTAKDYKKDAFKDLTFIAFSIVIENSFFTIPNTTEYLNYKPPLIQEDKRILHQSFLC